MATLLTALTVVTGVGVGAGAARAQDAGAFDVVVFEGAGLGHGLGLPLDGASYLATEESASARDVLTRFYPETELGREEGLVRFLVATRDDLGGGVDVELPRGGVVRDGRTRAVAPSFPIRVPSGRTVRITFDREVFRAEVLGERSVSGTHEVTSTTVAADGQDAATEGDEAASEGDGDSTASTGVEPGSTTSTSSFPALAASPNTLWIEPRDGGPLVVGRTESGEEVRTAGLHEVVLEAERLHLVGETDVETYLTGLSFMLDDETGLEPAALEAAVIAARTYALRSAASEPKIGRFHVFTDDRSLPFVGIGNGDERLAAAVEATAGRVVRHDGQLAATLVTTSAGGRTGVPGEVFAEASETLPYLASVDYPTAQEYRWRVEMDLDDVARRLDYQGTAQSITVDRRGPSERPIELVLDGDAGEKSIAAATFHGALRLPSTLFDVSIEERAEPVPDRDDSPPFQELPGAPLDGDLPVALDTVTPDETGGGLDLPPPYVLGSLAALAFALVLLALSRLAKRISARRGRAHARRRIPRAPAPRPAPTPPTPPPAAPEPTRPEAAAPEPDAPQGSTPDTRPPAVAAAEEPSTQEPTGDSPAIAGPTWHNEPEWLAEILRDEEAPDLEVEDVDEHTLRRSVERMRRESEASRERPLREVLGWDDAPDWLEEEAPDPDDSDGAADADDGDPDEPSGS